MKRFGVYKVNGLGKKVEVATVMADSFDYVGYQNYNFFNHKVGWLFGGVKERTLVHHYCGEGQTLVIQL